MIRPLLCSLLGLSLALAAASLSAQTVYQWKDAKGVTHYSDAPPPKGATKRELRVAKGSAVTTAGTTSVADAAKSPAAENADCAQARLNLARLQGNTEVGLDEDRDGKIDAPMSAEDRARQVQLVNAAISTHCPGER